jgi:hypothetical protein
MAGLDSTPAPIGDVYRTIPSLLWAMETLVVVCFPDVVWTLSPTVGAPLVDAILAFDPVKTGALTQDRPTTKQSVVPFFLACAHAPF